MLSIVFCMTTPRQHTIPCVRRFSAPAPTSPCRKSRQTGATRAMFSTATRTGPTGCFRRPSTPLGRRNALVRSGSPSKTAFAPLLPAPPDKESSSWTGKTTALPTPKPMSPTPARRRGGGFPSWEMFLDWYVWLPPKGILRILIPLGTSPWISVASTPTTLTSHTDAVLTACLRVAWICLATRRNFRNLRVLMTRELFWRTAPRTGPFPAGFRRMSIWWRRRNALVPTAASGRTAVARYPDRGGWPMEPAAPARPGRGFWPAEVAAPARPGRG